MAEVRKLCKEQETCLARRGKGPAAPPPPPSPSPAKRSRRERRKESDEDEEYDSLLPNSDSPLPKRDEVDTYLLMQDPTVKSDDILRWWKERVSEFRGQLKCVKNKIQKYY